MGAAVVLALAAFVIWAETPFAAGPEAIAALATDARVQVATDKWIVFEPAAPPARTGFVLYPGGRVDARAYAPVARRIAERGFLVVIVPVRLNLAFFDLDAAAPVLAAYPAIEHWAVGGHSLGGVAASAFAAAHPRVEGLALWAAYPADDALRAGTLRVVSVYGSRDAIAGDGVGRSRTQLPGDTTFVVIDGGNHSQFGAYGLQPGDAPATISPEAQWAQTADATAALLESLSPR